MSSFVRSKPLDFCSSEALLLCVCLAIEWWCRKEKPQGWNPSHLSRTHCVHFSPSLGIFFSKTLFVLWILSCLFCQKPPGGRNMMDKCWFRERVNISLVLDLWSDMSLLLNLKLIFRKRHEGNIVAKPTVWYGTVQLPYILQFMTRLVAVCQIRWRIVRDLHCM